MHTLEFKKKYIYIKKSNIDMNHTNEHIANESVLLKSLVRVRVCVFVNRN